MLGAQTFADCLVEQHGHEFIRLGGGCSLHCLEVALCHQFDLLYQDFKSYWLWICISFLALSKQNAMLAETHYHINLAYQDRSKTYVALERKHFWIYSYQVICLFLRVQAAKLYALGYVMSNRLFSLLTAIDNTLYMLNLNFECHLSKNSIKDIEAPRIFDNSLSTKLKPVLIILIN